MKPKAHNYYGVILAAGLGSRIHPLSMTIPKPMLPVCNKPIMQYQIEYLKKVGVSRIVVVVHHLKEKLMEHFGDGSKLGVEIRYVDQKHPHGIAHAVGLLEPHIDAPFFLFLGDIFLLPGNLGELSDLYAEGKAAACLAVKEETNPEYIRKNFGVILNQYGLVRRVVEKPRHVDTKIKGCGLYFFDLTIFDAIRRTPKTAMRDEYEITSAIQILIDDGYPVYSANVVRWDMNVTSPQDLLLCNLKQLQVMGKENVIGERVDMRRGAKIVNSVIGDDVIIRHPITIEKSLIVSRSVVNTKDSLRNTIVTPEGKLPVAARP